MRASAFVALVAIVSQRVAYADELSDAEQLYSEGQAAYDRGAFDAAVSAWERSYDLSHASGLLYNVAQARRLRAKAGDCVRARELYEQFVAASEPSPQRTLAEGYVRQLATCSSARASMPVPQIEGATSREEQSSAVHDAALALGIGGLAVLASGLYFGHRASTLSNEVAAACTIGSPCDWANEQGVDSDGRRDATLGWTFDAVGVAAIASGAVLYYLDKRGGHVRGAPAFEPNRAGGATVSWSSRW